VAIVTGAGGGLGRQHALALAARGAKVVVNDLGGARDGSGGSLSAAESVVAEIRAAGGEAMANGASVTDFEAVQAMVQQAMDAWGRVDILVNNAGILRDKSFAKMDIADFRTVVDVHLMGAVHCCKAVWPHMTEQKYGRILMTTSSSGLYGNFGQSNYRRCQAGAGGFDANPCTGRRQKQHPSQQPGPCGCDPHDRRLDATQVLEALKPKAVVPAMLVLVSEDAPTRTTLVRRCRQCGGCAHHAHARRVDRSGCTGARDIGCEPAAVLARAGDMVPESGAAQGSQEVTRALSHLAGKA